MPASMTGFARTVAQTQQGILSWEIRSINHRYLEPTIRLPDVFRELEPALRQKLREGLSRGKVDCQLTFQPVDHLNDIDIDLEMARQYLEACETVSQLMADPAPISPLDVLKWPGVLRQAEADTEALHQAALRGFDEALEELRQHRRREGDSLAEHIRQRLHAISAITAQVRQLMPQLLEAQRNRLLTRLEELSVQLPPERLEQEVVLLAQKSDVDEEVDRLDTHVSEIFNVLKRNEPVGRRLDFLMQELNREANTLGSKSQSSQTTQLSVELKVLIEQMREQIQNIE